MPITITIPDGYALGSNVNDVWYPLPVAEMTNDAWLHILEYGSQRIVNDKCGGKDKTPADKAKIATAKVEAFKANPYIRRASAGEGDPLISYIRQYFRDAFKADPSTDSAKAYKAAKGDARNDLLDDLFDKQSPDAQAAIRAACAKRRATVEADRKRTLEAAASAAKTLGLKL